MTTVGRRPIAAAMPPLTPLERELVASLLPRPGARGAGTGTRIFPRGLRVTRS
jgi:hypothetical protein